MPDRALMGHHFGLLLSASVVDLLLASQYFSASCAVYDGLLAPKPPGGSLYVVSWAVRCGDFMTFTGWWYRISAGRAHD